MVRTPNYEITKDLDGAIKLLRQANTIDLISPYKRETEDEYGRVCPLAYIGMMWGVLDDYPANDKIAQVSQIVFGEAHWTEAHNYAIHLYDSSRTKKEGLKKVLEYLKLYRAVQSTAIERAKTWAQRKVDMRTI